MEDGQVHKLDQVFLALGEVGGELSGLLRNGLGGDSPEHGVEVVLDVILGPPLKPPRDVRPPRPMNLIPQEERPRLLLAPLLVRSILYQ